MALIVREQGSGKEYTQLLMCSRQTPGSEVAEVTNLVVANTESREAYF